MNNYQELLKYKYIIYDFDLTICATIINWEGWHQGVSKIYQEFEPSFVRNGTVHQLYNQFLAKYGKPLHDKVAEFNAKYEIENMQRFEVNQALVDFIKADKSAKQYILSSNGLPLIEKGLQFCGLENYFEKIVSREDVLTIKPEPEGLNLIIGDLPKADFVMVGDSSFDEGAAAAAGIAFFKVTYF